MTKSTTTIRVSLFEYDAETHTFNSTPSYRRGDDGKVMSEEEALTLGICPSAPLLEEYSNWNSLDMRMGSFHGPVDDASESSSSSSRVGCPRFATLSELNDFNEKGSELVRKFREELAARTTSIDGCCYREDEQDDGIDVEVDDFRPLYSSIQVGDAVAGWWHVRDKLYNCVVPIQNLPISDDLKSRLMLWRKCKDENWFDEDCRRECNEQGHDLEEHILWELNVRFEEGKN